MLCIKGDTTSKRWHDYNKHVFYTSKRAERFSVLRLFEHSLRKTRTKVIWIQDSGKSCSELLAEIGIDLEREEYGKNIGKRDTCIFIDDAQAKFDQVGFWIELVKIAPNWLPSNVRFIISSTYLPSGGTHSPVEFIAHPGLNRGDFLLTESEAEEFLEMPIIGLPDKMKSDILKQVLIRECGGLIGALRQSIDALRERFANDTRPSETALLQYFLSDKILPRISRCFGSAPSAPIGNDFRLFLQKLFVDEVVYENGFSNPKDDASYSSLKKAGILVEPAYKTFAFSSPLAKRYCPTSYFLTVQLPIHPPYQNSSKMWFLTCLLLL